MENDLRYMDHTEKIVAEMLKSVLAPDEHQGGGGGRHGLMIDETVEHVIIDETETKLKNVSNNEMNKEPTYQNEFAMRMNHQPENQNMNNPKMSGLESFISDGLNKIRLEYPMYAAAANINNYSSCHNASVPLLGVSPLTENAVRTIPYNAWSNDPMNTRIDAACSPMYHDELNHIYGEEFWNEPQYDNNDVSVEWNESNVPPFKLTNNSTETSNDSNEDIEIETMSDEENSDDNVENDETKAANTLAAEKTVHCIMTQHDRRQILCNKVVPDSLMQAELSHFNVNSNLNGVSNATGGAATTHVQICAGSPTAIHAAQSTTTTTTTSAGFGVLHQQTSCTTTNFIPNNLANAVLATSPAALYAQSILTSTAHQYLNVFRKEIQQFFTNNIYGNATAASNWNFSIYERLLYAQLLQQQILQQQQQAAIATLLQQQKLALQSNAANIAAATAANAVAMSSNTPSNAAINNVGNNRDYQFATSFKTKKNTNMGKNDAMVNLAENNNFNSSMPAVTEDCMESREKAILK